MMPAKSEFPDVPATPDRHHRKKQQSTMSRPDQHTRKALARELIFQGLPIEEVIERADWQTDNRVNVQCYLYHGQGFDCPSSSREEKKEGEEARHDGTLEKRSPTVLPKKRLEWELSQPK
jgi:hypothetical protein